MITGLLAVILSISLMLPSLGLPIFQLCIRLLPLIGLSGSKASTLKMLFKLGECYFDSDSLTPPPHTLFILLDC